MSRQHNPITHYRQQGVALITAIFIVTIVATSAAYIAFNEQLWFRQTENRMDRAQSEAVRQGAIEGAIIMLLEDAKNNNTDHLNELWAKTPLAGEVGSGLFFATIGDAQGRFNLNNLLKKDGSPSGPDAELFRRLLTILDMPAGLADAALDWLDKDTQRRSTGAEDIDYMGLEQGYRTAASRFESVDELRLVMGFEPEMVDTLRDLVAALPERSSININSAPEPVFKALFPAPADLAAASAVFQQRGDKPFDNKSQLMSQMPAGQKKPDVDYDVKSSYFNVNVNTQFGRLNRWYETLIYRKDKTTGSLIWSSNRVLLIGTEKREE
ncbi:MAG: type II secretion system minor pseudopilin GspK [Proteobacteria bacterium]|nr:type II secretion system minor pseudopilin GspK [Pseudomonadota bacterium]